MIKLPAEMKAKDKGRPVVAVAMGDPAGISPELTAALLSDREIVSRAQLVVFGDRRVLAAGAAVAKVAPDVAFAASPDGPVPGDKPLFVDLGNLDPASIRTAEASLAGGTFSSDNFRRALCLAAASRADAVFFTPFNKAAMRMAYPGYDDEIRFVRDAIGSDAQASEFNILGGLWNARVTSHISLKEVAAAITPQRILEALLLADACLREAGFDPPRIAVAALNPHAGDGGNFGREEIEVIGPAVAAAEAQGLGVQGPYPSDTVFLRAKNGDFDAVLTMYHDQGQIAMKLMGFDRGVTLIGGFPFPICTPAHGTAYEIAGKGIANTGASRAALLLAIEMAERRRATPRKAA